MDRAQIVRDLTIEQGSDLAKFMCGVYLGSGVSRHVFEYDLDNSKVLKIEHGASFQNQIEWEIWATVREDTELSKWFAPCRFISPYGCWLIQDRTYPVAQKDLPKKVPSIFTDLKAANWGHLGDRIVCHDYGSSMCRLVNAASGKLRKADWF